MKPSEEAGGVVHWVRINPTAPGIAPYVTSKDPTAVGQGWQYRQRRVADVVASEHLAVAINGTLFSSKSSWRRWSGDLADAVNLVVADHSISHVWLDRYLLWFNDQLTPHLGPNKTTVAELAMAMWGIGEKTFDCGMVKFGLVTAGALFQMGELQWPSIWYASFCSWPSAFIS